ncbi:Protein farnesyltransferase subunit beta [Halotydeus destructor]|nr:Protein farnesyltransferase subunit beta [Halotydeus destructor]
MLRCLNGEQLQHYDDDDSPTHTSREQAKVEKSVLKCYDYIQSAVEIDPEIPKLHREQHIKYLKKGYNEKLPSSYQCLDCSKPWLTYWISHSLKILEDNATLSLQSNRIVDFLKRCSSTSGGYAGGPQQTSHLAATYAAINALVTLSDADALTSINRETLLKYLCDMKQPDGSFTMHRGGEIDVRGVYCAISVATITGLTDNRLYDKTADWVLTCQTYEGGFAGVPGGEAHGGYTFCAVAALALLGAVERCNVKSLLRWLVNKQLSLEGGFAGRTNKLVDGCYSFWQGGAFPIIHAVLSLKNRDCLPADKWLFGQRALQEYILCCCQQTLGGLIDKPGRNRDFYHTCYNLSGLSVAQNSMSGNLIVGGVGDMNRVVPVHPVFNINDDAVQFATNFFAET